MMIGIRGMPGKIASWVVLGAIVGGLCAASGSAAGSRNLALSGNSGVRASVADTQIAGEPPVDVDVYKACSDPAGWRPSNPKFVPASSYLAGWADAEKLNGSLVFGSPEPALAISAGTDEGKQGGTVAVGGITYLCTRILLQLNYHGLRELPPVRATFLAYGFMPVTATVQFAQLGPQNLSACIEPDGTTSPDCPPLTAIVMDNSTSTSPEFQDYQVVATAQLAVRLSNVTVNGQSLDVGNSCRTGAVTTPGNPIGFDGAVLTGGNITGDPVPEYANPFYGGALDGSLEVPPATDCGVNGDLDPVLTSALSGSGNYTKLIQSLLCATGTINGSCEADGTTPAIGPLWTVADGGTYKGSGSLTVSPVAAVKVNCPNSVISGSIPDLAGVPRGDLGTAHWTFGDCTSSDGGTWTVSQQGTAGLDGVTAGALSSQDPGVSSLKIGNESFTLQGWGGNTGGTEQQPCQVTLAEGGIPVTYTNPTGSAAANMTLSGTGYGGFNMRIISSTCKNIVMSNAPTGTMAGSYTLNTGSGITIANIPPNS